MKKLLLLTLLLPLYVHASEYQESNAYTTAVIAGVALSAIPVASYFIYKKYNLPIPDYQAEQTPGCDLSMEDLVHDFYHIDVRTCTEIRTGHPSGISNEDLASLAAEEMKYRTHKEQYWRLLHINRNQESRLKESSN
jgi:hypothetical protein